MANAICKERAEQIDPLLLIEYRLAKRRLGTEQTGGHGKELPAATDRAFDIRIASGEIRAPEKTPAVVIGKCQF
jgi:hypothetical protein